jgi:SAM-dependent methyltransferase
MIPNSREWWDNFFVSGWEKPSPGINVPDQTRYFMELILKHCGLEISGSVLDYGCAMGQGVGLIDGAEGYDFSEVAIQKAREMVPGHEFTHEFPTKKYDFVICSNVLEHFEDPLNEFMKLLNLAKKYVIILTPYNQPSCEVHPVTITEESFPPRIHGFIRSHKLIPNEKPEMGGGNQIMFVYEYTDNAYFTIYDEYSDKIYDFTIPPEWWNRIYEYVWAKRRIIPGETVVDAGSGPNYPFQYVLADTCKVYSLDINPDLLNSKPHENITHIVTSIDNTGLTDNSIDTVYCISVLEHLSRAQAEATLREFHRILKPGGRVVLTMDLSMTEARRYAWVYSPAEFFELAEGFKYAPYEIVVPDNAIKDYTHELYCYHAVLYKEDI